jgi:ATP synthase subunit b
MAAEQTLNNREILDATQNAVIDAAGSVVQVVENVEQEISGHSGVFYENPEFWVAVAFVLVVAVLAKPVARLLNEMLNRRIEAIADRITEAQKLNEDAQKMLAEYEKKYLNAEKEARNILRKSEKEIEFLKEDRLKKLEADMEMKQKEAEQRIKTAQEAAMKEITTLTSEMTIRALKEVLAKNLDKKAQDRLIEASIEEISKLK